MKTNKIDYTKSPKEIGKQMGEKVSKKLKLNLNLTPSNTDRIYPCAKCGVMRSKDEGGTTFSICDGCWEKQYGEKKGETLPQSKCSCGNPQSFPIPHEHDQTGREKQIIQHYETEIKRVKEIAWKEENEIEQILGKVLGYPWYKDDQKNFPNATEANGVCTGDNVPLSLAMEAVTKIMRLEEEIREIAVENTEFRERVDAWENLEASVCPEDIGLVEYIKWLKAEISKLKKLKAQDKIRLAEYWEKKILETREQAQGELSGWIRCPHCGSGQVVWGKDGVLLECEKCKNQLKLSKSQEE